MPTQSKWQSLPTEQINPATLAIDKLTPADIVEGMLNEDRKMIAAVQREKDRIAVGVEIITQALRKNGRIVFVGAGTSGRLGVLESAEMPPTFGTSPDLVQAVMAGGKGAVLRAREGVEDNYEEGMRSINRLRPTKKDVVIGVSASGMTPFVRGGLREHGPEAHPEEAADRGGYLYPPQIQSIGTLDLQDEHALHVVERRHHSGERLVVYRHEALYRRQCVTNRRFGLAPEQVAS